MKKFGIGVLQVGLTRSLHFGKHYDRASREWARPDAAVGMETALQAVMAQ